MAAQLSFRPSLVIREKLLELKAETGMSQARIISVAVGLIYKHRKRLFPTVY